MYDEDMLELDLELRDDNPDPRMSKPIIDFKKYKGTNIMTEVNQAEVVLNEVQTLLEFKPVAGTIIVRLRNGKPTVSSVLKSVRAGQKNVNLVVAGMKSGTSASTTEKYRKLEVLVSEQVYAELVARAAAE
jgi:hypothetical protein